MSEPRHSPLGASGTHRWMRCPGSVGLSAGVEDPESDHASLGTVAHTLAAQCLMRNGEPWQHIGKGIDGNYPDIAVDKDMADAVQIYVSAVEEAHPDRNQGNSWVERHFRCPEIHELFYGTADFVYLEEPAPAGDRMTRGLHVWDYKHGSGIVVEVQRNPQLMYYACGALEDLGLWEEVDQVVLHVAQPRISWHPAGPVREWSISTDDLNEWLHAELISAMDRAMVSDETESGEHCRFCPARFRKCPQLWADSIELEELMRKAEKGGASKLTAEELGRLLKLGEVFKIQHKAARETAFARATERGTKIPGMKLVKARADRVWRDGAEEAAIEKFGKKNAFTEPELKTPAQLEKLPLGKAFASEFAFKPDAGLALVPEGDTRHEYSPAKREGMFTPVEEKSK